MNGRDAKIAATLGLLDESGAALKDVRTLAQEALSTVLPKSLVFSENYERKTGEEWPEEYITFYVDDETEGHHADGRALLVQTTVIVHWFGKQRNPKRTRPKEVARAMKRYGFRVINRQTDIPRDAGAVFYGFAAEYLFEAVEDDGDG